MLFPVLLLGRRLVSDKTPTILWGLPGGPLMFGSVEDSCCRVQGPGAPTSPGPQNKLQPSACRGGAVQLRQLQPFGMRLPVGPAHAELVLIRF